MNVPVMNIREMWMTVLDREVCVPVTVSDAVTPIKPMCVLVVLVMFVFMRVFQNLMQVLMSVVFSEVQPYAQAHQCRSNPEGQ